MTLYIIPLVHELPVLFSHHVTSGEGLELSEDVRQSLVPQILKTAQYPSTEEHLWGEFLV